MCLPLHLPSRAWIESTSGTLKRARASHQGKFKGRIVKTLDNGEEHVIEVAHKTSWLDAITTLSRFR